MTDRKAFFQLVVKDQQRVKSGGNGGSGGLGERRRFLESLVSKPSTSSSSAGPDVKSVVQFSMAQLRDFKGSQMAATSFKTPPEIARKRPNYDSSKRKMYANPIPRVKYQDFIQFIFMFSEVCTRGKMFDSPSKVNPSVSPRHSENGVDPARVQALLGHRFCLCSRGKCFKKFKPLEGDLIGFLEMYWSLEKPAQDGFD